MLNKNSVWMRYRYCMFMQLKVSLKELASFVFYMKKEYLGPSVFFIAHFLLAKEEGLSCKENPLYQKILNKELSAVCFEKLFKDFRCNLQNELLSDGICFHEPYQWCEIENHAVFCFMTDADTKKFKIVNPIQPDFIVCDRRLVVRHNGIQEEFCTVIDSIFYTCMTPGWPWPRFEFPLSEVYDSCYSEKLVNAMRLTLQSFEE